ncbi:MAG: peptidoglycan-binding protein [Clostridiales bacterium]|nr:peptidoglycan-binding protein [Clostridiales bacterium]
MSRKKRKPNGSLWMVLLLAALVFAALAPGLVSLRNVSNVQVLYTPELSVKPAVTPTPTSTIAPTPTPIPSPTEYVLYSKKNAKEKIDDVSLIQARLRQLGYYVGEVDGKYGDSTFEAIKTFQRINLLTIDGMAGEATQRKLFEDENVLDATGRVYAPFVEPSLLPAPTPTPAPAALSMTDFTAGGVADPRLQGGTRYVDSSISAELSVLDDSVTVKVSVIHPSQIRCVLAGNVRRPARAEIEELAKTVNAVVAFAGTSYETGGLEARQGTLLNDSFSDRPLMIIDENGIMSVFDPYYAFRALDSMHGHIYQAMSVDAALIINGVLQPKLSRQQTERVTALGQTKHGDFIIINGVLSPQILSERMERLGADNAVIVGEGGLYTAFGSLTRFTYDTERVSNLMYFATLGNLGDTK